MTQNSHRLLRFKQVQAKVNLGHTCIYEKIKNNKFPKPIPIGLRAIAFLENEIDEWIEERIKASRGSDSDA